MAVLRRFAWVLGGLAVAALIAALFGTQRAWILMMGYALLNLLGAALVLRTNTEACEQVEERSAGDDSFEKRLPVILKAGFVAQLPFGLVLLLLEGL